MLSVLYATLAVEEGCGVMDAIYAYDRATLLRVSGATVAPAGKVTGVENIAGMGVYYDETMPPNTCDIRDGDGSLLQRWILHDGKVIMIDASHLRGLLDIKTWTNVPT